jgi:AhpD family alkylhydroperoxidase
LVLAIQPFAHDIKRYAMSNFPLHTIESAPEKSKPVLRALQQTFGFIPNVAATMAESPVLINGFIGVFENVHAGSFTEAQMQTLLLTNAITNACPWAVAFHTALALKHGLDPADVQAIRERRVPTDAKHAALSTLAKRLIEKRGRLDDGDLRAFFASGFGSEHVLEVITVVAASTITNYAGNVAAPPLEDAFAAHAWSA